MVSGVRGCFVGSAFLAVLAMLSGCSGGFFFAERESWRGEAEVQCVNAGLVTEGAGMVRLSAIRGPGACGMDYPFKVSVFGESAPIAFADDLRPPGTIPSGAPNWPIAASKPAPAAQEAAPRYSVRPRREERREESAPVSQGPISLNPPAVGEAPAPLPENYDFRRRYGAAVGAPSNNVGAPAQTNRVPRAANAPREDFSPEPYERRRLVQPEGTARVSSSAVTRAPLREPVQLEPTNGVAREDWT